MEAQSHAKFLRTSRAIHRRENVFPTVTSCPTAALYRVYDFSHSFCEKNILIFSSNNKKKSEFEAEENNFLRDSLRDYNRRGKNYKNEQEILWNYDDERGEDRCIKFDAQMQAGLFLSISQIGD